MSVEFRLPDVGEGLSQAELLEWHVVEGQQITEDDPLVEVQTDKAVVDLTSPATGTVEKLCFAAGDTVPIGSVLVRIATDRAAAPARGRRRPLASPAVRRAARDRGIDLTTVTGSGPEGRIRAEDLDTHEPPRPAPAATPRVDRGPQPGQVLPLRGLRRTIAETLTAAWQTVPRVIDYREVDFEALADARGQLKRRAQDAGDAELASALTITPLLMKTVAVALRRHPMLNASIDLQREEITVHPRVDMGIATSTPDGLLVPVVRDVASKSVAELARESAELATAARERRLTAAELGGGTITINNYGALGIWLGTPIVVPPQVANIGFGRMEQRPVVIDGEVVVRRVAALACAGDHRLLDGDTIAAFVNELIGLIEHPYLLLGELT